MALSSTLEHKAREFDLTTSDFERIRQLIYEQAGIRLAATKHDMVYSRLVSRLREKGMRNFTEYLKFLEKGDKHEWQEFTNALTTNLTAFYREAHHFPILGEHLAERRRQSSESLAVWCCAASTGEEPYTIAMTAVEALNVDAPISILATDVDTQVLAKADAGIYDLERINAIGSERTRRFFLRGEGSRAGKAKVRPELRRLITFQQFNLLDASWSLRGKFDAIMCRNVMIYFDKNTQRQILEKFVPLLKPDGLLFAGHSESFLQHDDLFKLRGKTVYELAGG
jgi:chemotaxis protein methyltransferase CheR